MLSIGLTGGIGSGKTFVTEIIKRNNNNIKIFDSDLYAKKIINNEKLVIKSIISIFGEKAYLDKKINSTFISEQVFNNYKKLKKLNSIVHPFVIEYYKKFKSRFKDKIIVTESALLFETGMHKLNDINVLVTSPMKTRIKRISLRDNTTVDNILKIINSQWDDKKKSNLADFVIENNSKAGTDKKVKQLISKIITQNEKN
tara:strand:- start:4717 stop:5316 length:600 start_codon:yes stop_codon:yes gene_type:complete